MHRDVKIGLILGVLLIALVAVLFFRREPIEDLVSLVQPPANNSPATIPMPSPPPSLVRVQPTVVVEPTPNAPRLPVANPAAQPLNNASSPLGPILVPTSPPSPQLNNPGTNGATRPVTDGQHLPFRPSADESAHRSPWEAVPMQPVPNSAAPRKHRIQAGDSLWRLAERYLGEGHRADEIFRINQNVLKSPDRLPLGTEIAIPAADVADHRLASSSQGAQTSPALRATDAPPAIVEGRQNQASQERADAGTLIRRYRVKPGETLREIARKVFRDEERWRDIFRENRALLNDPRNLQAGMTIRLPVR